MRATIFLMGHFAASSNKIRSDSEPDRDRDRSIVLTAATTGDTGPAAVRAVEDLNSSNLGIVVHYPEGQISDFQRKQMTTIDSDRVEIVSFEGGGDDMDGPIKNIMMQKENNNSNSNTNSNSEILVCGVNSYNIGRPLMQMVHFVWTYLRVVEDIEQKTQQKINHDNFELDVVIPTGAMGNIAGCVSGNIVQCSVVQCMKDHCDKSFSCVETVGAHADDALLLFSCLFLQYGSYNIATLQMITLLCLCYTVYTCFAFDSTWPKRWEFPLGIYALVSM